MMKSRYRMFAGGFLAGLVSGAVLEWIRLGALPWLAGREVRVAAAVLALWAIIAPERVRAALSRRLSRLRPLRPEPASGGRSWAVPWAGAAAGLLAWEAPGSLFLVAAFLACFHFALKGWPPEERRWLGRLIYAALALRLLFIFIYYPLASSMGWTAAWLTLDVPPFHVPVLFGDGADAINMSRAWALFWRGEWVSPSEVQEIFNPDRSFFSIHGDVRHLLPQAALFFLFGVETLGARVLSAVVSVGAGVVAYAALRNRFGARTAWCGAALLAFWPTLFLWSLDALKEPYFLLLLMSSACFAERVPREGGWKALAASVALLGAALSIRTRWFPPLALTVAVCLGGFLLQRALRRSSLMKRVGCGLVLLALIGSFLALWPPSRRLILFYTYESVSAQRNFAVGYGSGYKVWPAEYYARPTRDFPKILQWQDAAGAWGRNLGHVLFEPFPKGWNGWKGVAYFGVAVPWWMALAAALWGGWEIAVRRDGFGWMCLAYVGITLGFLAAFSGNVGTLIRHRDTASPILLLIAAVGVSALWDRVRPGGSLPSSLEKGG